MMQISLLLNLNRSGKNLHYFNLPPLDQCHQNESSNSRYDKIMLM